VLKTDAPFIADKLYVLKTQIWNEALTFLGINNVNITKKERLLNDEVNRNQGGTIASRYSRLVMRQKACEEINKMFGTNISVDYREDLKILDEAETGDFGEAKKDGDTDE
jgi:Phage Connector (GP10).